MTTKIIVKSKTASDKYCIFNSMYFRKFKYAIITIGFWPEHTCLQKFLILFINQIFLGMLFTGQVLNN